MNRFLTALAVCLLVCSNALFAATRKEIPGGWYGENLPTGEFAVAVPSAGKLVTHVGDVPFGPDEPLYVRITNAGGFKLAGQGHNTGRTVEWGGGFWNIKPVACGVSPVIYDLFSVLHISDCSIGSQGWRYVEDGTGRLVTGDETYVSGPLQLYEFTVHGDISVGQGGNGGAIAVSPAGRFMLEPGHTTFIRYNRSGTHIAVTIVKLLEAKTVLLWFEASELASFPREGAPAPAPTPTPTPVPVPVPVPQTSHVPEDILKDLTESRKHYPTPLGAHGSDLINEVAWRAHQRGVDAGLEEKPGGNNCPQPKTSIPVACDILRIGNIGFDVLGDQEGAGVVGQADGGPATRKFISPVDPGTTSTPPPPPSVDPRIAELTAKLAELEQKYADLHDEFVRVHTAEWNQIAELQSRQRELEAERDQLKGQLETLRSAPAPTCSARVETSWARSLGARASCSINK